MIELGPIEKNIALQAVRSGQPLPDRIANAPELKLGLQLYLTAFFDLDAERESSMSIGRIPWSAIDRYARAYDLDSEQYEDMHFFIKQMDSEHIKRIKAKEKWNHGKYAIGFSRTPRKERR